MTDDNPVATRRTLLAGLGSVGALTAAGATTTASFIDEEKVSGSMRAGQLTIGADCDGCVLEDGRLRLRLEPISTGEKKTKSVRLTIPEDSNAARLWLRTGCPPVTDPLGEALEARLSVRPDCSEDERQFPLSDAWTTFSTLRRELHDGVRLDDPEDPCLPTGAQVCLNLEYRLPDGATWAVDTRTNLVLELYAKQCRHVPEDAVGAGPFPAEDCPTVDCPDCIKLGKLEVQNDRLEPRVYDFDELYNNYEDDNEFQLEVLTVTNKVDEAGPETICASVRLLKDGSESSAPPLCKVDVKGGRESVTYDIDPPLTRTRGEVCTTTDAANSGHPPGKKTPAISNMTVFVCPGEVNADG